ncbi:MAG: hypothetical protein HY700_07445 [Gemmatimonadetes bacterium]|nr:hypothetical protein [Gemmatimonadota bacterium]
MNRATLRRLGGLFLFLAWVQVATANAMPCAVSCLLEKDLAHHHHEGLNEDHAIGHHMSGSAISAPEFCGTPQLMVVSFVPPDFPLPPMVEVAVLHLAPAAPVSVVSAVLEFATPPPRA